MKPQLSMQKEGTVLRLQSSRVDDEDDGQVWRNGVVLDLWLCCPCCINFGSCRVLHALAQTYRDSTIHLKPDFDFDFSIHCFDCA